MSEIKPDKKDIEDNKVIAALGYVSIICFVPLFLKKDSKFAQFHAKQGLILFIMELLGFLPLIGWVLFVIAVLFAIWGIKSTLEGKYWKMPILGDFADKLNI